MAEELLTIKKIKVGSEQYAIDAAKLNGKSYEDLVALVQGAIGTFVIPVSNEEVSGYNDVVNSTESVITTTKSILNALTNSTDVYKVGDIILMEAESLDGTKVFDRWVSAVGTGDDPTITLAVLETQVAKHHHTITSTTGDVVTGVTETATTNAIPTVGAPVTVLTGETGDVITSVEYDETGDYNFELSSEEGEGSVGHSHTVDAHSHSVSLTPSDLVNETIDAYTELTTDTLSLHTHTTTTVAGAHSDAAALTFATGGGSTETFVKTLKDSQSTTGEESLTTDSNADGLTTSAQKGDDTVGDVVKTTTTGSHTHSVSGESTSDVVTGVTLADTVVTSVDFTYVAPTVQATVATGVTSTTADVISTVDVTPTSANFVNGWSVDDEGVLSLTGADALTGVTANTTTATVLNSVTATTASQTAGSASLEKTTASQSSTSGKVSFACTTDAAGDHAHGFSHTHAIPAHTHSIVAHSHTYNKSVTDATGIAYTSLTTDSYVPHTHTNATVIADMTDGSEVTFVNGGSKATVVKDLKATAQTFTTTSDSANTDTKYVKISGNITFPGLTLGKKTLSTTTVTPAVAGTEKALASISVTTDKFVKTVSDKTSVNIGGEPTTK